MIHTLEDKLEAAIIYLRSRSKYIVDVKCNFIPTKALQTDVAETVREYRMKVENVASVQLVKSKKK